MQIGELTNDREKYQLQIPDHQLVHGEIDCQNAIYSQVNIGGVPFLFLNLSMLKYSGKVMKFMDYKSYRRCTQLEKL